MHAHTLLDLAAAPLAAGTASALPAGLTATPCSSVPVSTCRPMLHVTPGHALVFLLAAGLAIVGAAGCASPETGCVCPAEGGASVGAGEAACIASAISHRLKAGLHAVALCTLALVVSLSGAGAVAAGLHFTGAVSAAAFCSFCSLSSFLSSCRAACMSALARMRLRGLAAGADLIYGQTQVQFIQTLCVRHLAYRQLCSLIAVLLDRTAMLELPDIGREALQLMTAKTSIFLQAKAGASVGDSTAAGISSGSLAMPVPDGCLMELRACC